MAKGKKRKIGRKKLILIVVILAAVVGIGLGVLLHFLTTDTEEGIAVYNVAELCGTKMTGQNYYAGVVESQDTVDIKVDPEKKIKEVFVKEGDYVKKGTKLFEYDESSMEDELTQAKIDLQQFDIDIAEAKSQIKALKEEKKSAPSSEKVTYTLQIQLQENEITRTQYEKEKKKAEVEKLEKNMGKTVVSSEIEGKITKIQSIKQSDSDDEEMDLDNGNDQSDVLMKIMGLGSYRVRCQINELEFSDILEGMEMSVHSRVSEDVYDGTISAIDRGGEEEDENSDSEMMNDMGEITSGQEELTSSTSYNFYVELEDSSDLMLGQHVYVTKRQKEEKKGLWLDEMYIVDAEEDAYVWVSDAKGKLQKREILLGSYDAELFKYKIESGLEESDWIAFPDEALEQGDKTKQSSLNDTATDVSGEEEFDEEEFGEDEEYDLSEEVIEGEFEDAK